MKGWIPVKLKLIEEQILCEWEYVDDMFFTKPFFGEENLSNHNFKNNPQLLKSYTDLNVFYEESLKLPDDQPSLVIFHISRCGSTLATQMLAQSKDIIVLSENPFIDNLLMMKSEILQLYTHLNIPQLLKAAIGYFGSYRFSTSKYLCIKTDSWHLLFYHDLREAFPKTPFVMLYRHPSEVLLSQQRSRGIQAVPGVLPPSLLGINFNELRNYSLDEYMCLVLQAFLNSMVKIKTIDPRAYLINYNQGAIVLLKKILYLANLQVEEEILEKMELRTAFHSKYPSQTYIEERATQKLPDSLKPTISTYTQLETLRNQQLL